MSREQLSSAGMFARQSLGVMLAMLKLELLNDGVIVKALVPVLVIFSCNVAVLPAATVGKINGAG